MSLGPTDTSRMASTIKETLEGLRRQGRKALMPYITAGDPSMSFTRDMIVALAEAGADMIELGVPFADPVGDGPVIQRSVQRALVNRVSIEDVLVLVKSLRADGINIPIILLGFLNPLFNLGYENFAAKAGDAGVSGSLVADLPPEEAEEYREALQSRAIDTIFLTTPLTSPGRLQLLDQWISGFCYYVSRKGVTGGQQELSSTLGEELEMVRRHISKPVLVGFGIRTPEQARAVGELADGVIIGTAFVQCIEDAVNEQAAAKAILDLTAEIKYALEPGSL